MKPGDLIERISAAFQQLFANDKELFDLGTKGINEQTLTFRLGIYLADQFQHHHVDCEYNRLWDGTKRCVRFGINWMKPDVIVHVRRSDTQNLFCLEAKKVKHWTTLKAIPKDVANKLAALTHPQTDYHYLLGLGWRVAPSCDPENHDAVWFIAGKPKLTTCLTGFEADLREKLGEAATR